MKRKVLFIRTKDEVHEAIEKLAKKNFRSINQQAEFMLVQSLKRDGKL